MSNNPRLSLTMIVKNEAVHMRRALTSARVFADEIIVVDTGSTDGTRQLAEELADKVYDFEWIDDFSAARNYGVERCNGDYIIWLDADDVISAEHGKILRDAVATEPNWDVLWLPYIYSRTRIGTPKTTLKRERVFRNGLGIKFEFPIHECLKVPPKMRREVLQEVKVIHDNLGRKEPSKDRNLRILYKAVETEEYRKNFRMWDHLARDSLPVKGVLFFQKIVDEFFGELNPPMKSRVFIRYGDALMALSRFEEALEMYGRAAAQFPLWREPFFGAGKALMKLKRNESALKMFLIAGTIDAPGAGVRSFNQAMYDGELYFDWLFLAQKRLGRRADMLVTIEQALKIHPTSEMFLKRKAEFMPQPQSDAA